MTKKTLGLLMLAAVVLVGSTFAGCNKPTKDQQLAQAKLEIANLQGQLASQQNMVQENDELRVRLSDAEAEATEGRVTIRTLQDQGNRGTAERGARAGEVMEISGGLNFAAGSDRLTAAGKGKLDTIVSTLRSRHSGRRISVEGHTDSSPLRVTKDKWHTNLWLSANRARAVADYLMQRGISENLISVVGHGYGQGKGRRVEIIVRGR